MGAFKWASVAASLAFIAVAGILYMQRATPIRFITRTAAQGQMLRVELPDSSFVFLSAKSSFKYPERFNESSRDVYLVGEAFFEVHRDTDYPFIVHTNHISTRVLGTKFLVQAYPSLDNIEVKVAEGKVQVRDSSSTLSTLVKNQVLTYSTLGKVEIRQEIVQERSESNMDRVLVKNASFNEVALRILNIYGYQLKTSNPLVLNTQFTGDIILRQPVTIFLDKFCAIHGIKYVITGREIVVL